MSSLCWNTQGLIQCTDAIPPFLWMYQHRGNLFSTKRRAALTVFNGLVMILGVAIVSCYCLQVLFEEERLIVYYSSA